MENIDLISFFIVGLLAVLNQQVIIAWKIVWAAAKGILFGREYNLDGNTDTSDWCEEINKAGDRWGLLEIRSYHLLYVRTYMRDKLGELHQRDIPILEWITTRATRRHTSEHQKCVIAEAGGWPPLSPEQPAGPHVADQLATLCSYLQNFTKALDKARQSREAGQLKTAELLTSKTAAMVELATSNRDMARSLDSAGTKISNAGKKVAKAWEG